MSATADHALPDHRIAPGLVGLAERGWLPDPLVRYGIRRQCAQRLRDETRGGQAETQRRQHAYLDQLRAGAMAIDTDAANRQHYELPPGFFKACLGERLKYSCCYYPTGRESLDEAELAMLELYLERAQLQDGQSILELGCGWGSLTLLMARRFPAARITAVSNSERQRIWILDRCDAMGLSNVSVLTRDVNHLELPPDAFDRCVSIEMFEHMRNHEHLLSRIAQWLRPHGVLFVHLFCHRTFLYPFESTGEQDWMARHFFTGGVMPSADLLMALRSELAFDERWLIDGTHYQRTANDWLEQHDRHRDEVLLQLELAYAGAAMLWNQRWRMFWMACAELFGYRGGREWMVAHYRFRKEN